MKNTLSLLFNKFLIIKFVIFLGFLHHSTIINVPLPEDSEEEIKRTLKKYLAENDENDENDLTPAAKSDLKSLLQETEDLKKKTYAKEEFLIISLMNMAWFLYSKYGHILNYLHAAFAAPKAFYLDLPINKEKFQTLLVILNGIMQDLAGSDINPQRFATQFLAQPINQFILTDNTSTKDLLQNPSFSVLQSREFQEFEGKLKPFLSKIPSDISIIDKRNYTFNVEPKKVIISVQPNIQYLQSITKPGVKQNPKDSKFGISKQAYMGNSATLLLNQNFLSSILLGFLLYPHFKEYAAEKTGSKIIRTITFNSSFFDKFLQKIHSTQGTEHDKKALEEAITISHNVFKNLWSCIKNHLGKAKTQNRRSMFILKRNIISPELIESFEKGLVMPDNVYSSKWALLKTTGGIAMLAAGIYLGYSGKLESILPSALGDKVKDFKGEIGSSWDMLKKGQIDKLLIGNTTDLDMKYGGFWTNVKGLLSTTTYSDLNGSKIGNIVRQLSPFKQWNGMAWNMINFSVRSTTESLITTGLMGAATFGLGLFTPLAPVVAAIVMWDKIGSVANRFVSVACMGASVAGMPSSSCNESSWLQIMLSPSNAIRQFGTKRIMPYLQSIPYLGSKFKSDSSILEGATDKVFESLGNRERIVLYKTPNDIYPLFMPYYSSLFNMSLSDEYVKRGPGASIMSIIDTYKMIGQVVIAANSVYDFGKEVTNLTSQGKNWLVNWYKKPEKNEIQKKYENNNPEFKNKVKEIETIELQEIKPIDEKIKAIQTEKDNLGLIDGPEKTNKLSTISTELQNLTDQKNKIKSEKIAKLKGELDKIRASFMPDVIREYKELKSQQGYLKRDEEYNEKTNTIEKGDKKIKEYEAALKRATDKKDDARVKVIQEKIAKEKATMTKAQNEQAKNKDALLEERAKYGLEKIYNKKKDLESKIQSARQKKSTEPLTPKEREQLTKNKQQLKDIEKNEQLLSKYKNTWIEDKIKATQNELKNINEDIQKDKIAGKESPNLQKEATRLNQVINELALIKNPPAQKQQESNQNYAFDPMMLIGG